MLYFLLAGGFGIVYGVLATRFASMRRAPGSVLWGIGYGLVVWWLLNDLVVPLTGADNVQPLWEGLLGTVGLLRHRALRGHRDLHPARCEGAP